MYETVPAELRTRRQWVGWRYEQDPKRPDKPKKVPVDPMTGERGQSNNRRPGRILIRLCVRWSGTASMGSA